MTSFLVSDAVVPVLDSSADWMWRIDAVDMRVYWKRLRIEALRSSDEGASS